MRPALAVLTVLSALWHVHVPVAAAGLTLAVPVPALIAVAELAALAGLVVLAVLAVRSFRSAPWPRPVRPIPSGGAW